MDKKGKLLFTCTLVVGEGSNTSLVQIKNNEFVVANPLIQKNFNEKALEVADDNGSPLLQVIQESANELRINGIFLAMIGLDRKPVSFWAWQDQVSVDAARPKDFSLKPIFKYPRWKYPGKYADGSN
jgi:hypothetical protein